MGNGADTTVDVLRCVNKSGLMGVSSAEVAETVGISRGYASKILSGLLDAGKITCGLIESDLRQRTYRRAGAKGHAGWIRIAPE